MKRKLRVLGVCLGMLLALSPVNAFAAEETAIDIQTDSFSYHTTSPYRLQDMPSIWHMDHSDTLYCPDTSANFLVTGVYRSKINPEKKVYTVIWLNHSSSASGKLEGRVEEIFQDREPKAGDLIQLGFGAIAE